MELVVGVPRVAEEVGGRNRRSSLSRLQLVAGVHQARLVRGLYGFFYSPILALCGDDAYEATEVNLLRSLPGALLWMDGLACVLCYHHTWMDLRALVPCVEAGVRGHAFD
mmetsp:Transcript_16860/g.33232  ORF Transcript_16860/g.33232 Transcript_16860/m.33232 type:complete len:110 (+) Transcript_16860:191-520(+)